MIALFDAEAPGFVPRPPSGSRRVARLRAMWHFHLGRMRGLKWMERVQYIQERLAQVPLNLIDAFYARNHARMEQWGRRFPWLPSRLFFNRFTQIGQLQTDHVEQLNARIQLFRARDVTVIPGSDPACGWGDVARLGVAVSYIPGHHESMFLEPNVEILKKEFQAAMRTVEASLAAGKHFPQA
jgi:thioesterase domain-containing protein